MAVLPIRTLPDPVLRQKAKRVKSIDKSIHKLIDDMVETMHSASGAGLAAPQVGVPLRVIVIGMPEEEEEIQTKAIQRQIPEEEEEIQTQLEEEEEEPVQMQEVEEEEELPE